MFADNTGKTWMDARKHCIDNGGDLISLTTSAKWEFVSNFTSCKHIITIVVISIQ